MKFGSLVLSTIGYHNLLYYRAAGVYAIKEGISLYKSQEILKGKAESLYPKYLEHESIEYKQLEAKLGISIILNDPMLYVQNHISSIFNMFFRPMRSTIDLQLDFSNKRTTLNTWGEKSDSSLLSRLQQNTSVFTIWMVIVQVSMLIIVWAFFTYGVFISFMKNNYLLSYVVLMVIVYFSIVAGGPETYARFRVPFVAFLAIGGSVGIVAAYERLKARTKRVRVN